MKMNKLHKTIVFTLIISMLLALTGCKNSSATKAVDEYLKHVQESPYSITVWYKWNDDGYRHVLEDLISGMEYEILGESDYENGKRLQEKAVSVKIKGYDIGGFYEKYLDNRTDEVYAILKEKYTDYELATMNKEKPDEYQTILLEADLRYFKAVMEECKEAGKIYTCKDAMFIAYYSESEKEWLISANKHTPEYIDYITNNFNSILSEYASSN